MLITPPKGRGLLVLIRNKGKIINYKVAKKKIK